MNMKSRLYLFLSLALLGTACGAEINLKELDRSLAVTPMVEDLGDLPVGATRAFSLQLDSLKGSDVTVHAVDVANVMGGCFSFTGELPVVPSGGSAELTFECAPEDEGYHWGQATIVSDAVESSIVVDLRAHAGIVQLGIWPGVLDLGVVQPGSRGARTLTITNPSEFRAEVAGATVEPASFWLDASWPLSVAPGSFVAISAFFEASNLSPATGEVLFDAEGLGLPELLLRANDCENGDPSAYDVDLDGYTSCAGDCDDLNHEAHPGLPEDVPGVDDDCDGLIDEGTEAFDDDADGFTEEDGDCSDADPSVYPGAEEDMTNGIDDDCDGVVDAGTTDADGDGYAIEGGDCDDLDPAVHPGALETPDANDEDCDGLTDEGTEVYDDDGDSYSEIEGDCDDANYFTRPGVTESADGIDNDCDGTVDEGTARYDDDRDGYSEEGGDCNDANSAIRPGIYEVPGDGIDNNCDGTYT